MTENTKKTTVLDFRNFGKNLWANCFVIAAIVITINNLYVIALKIHTQAISFDEANNTHLAWKVLNGELIYKDFFDNHAPLYTFLNSFLLSIFKTTPSFETFFSLRIFSYIALIISFLLIFLICLELTKSYKTATYSLMFFSMWDVVQNHAIEIRPESIQIILSIITIWFLLKSLKSETYTLSFFSGAFLGLNILFDFQAVGFLLALFVFALTELALYREKKYIQALLSIIFGVVVVFLLCSIYFYINKSFQEFVYYFTVYNKEFHVVDHWTSNDARQKTFDLFFKKDLYLTILFLLAVFNIDNTKQENRFLFTIIFVMIPVSYFGLFPNYTLLYIGFVSIVVAMFFSMLIEKNFFTIELFPILQVTIIIVFVFLLIKPANNFMNYKEIVAKQILLDQKQSEWVLDNISREEKVAKLRFTCPAFVFNQDLRFNWIFGPYENMKFDKDLGSQEFIDEIEDKNIRLFFAYPWELEWQNIFLKDFINNNFHQLEFNSDRLQNCIWIRNDQEARK